MSSTVHPTNFAPDTVSPLADSVMTTALRNQLAALVTSAGRDGVTYGVAPFDGSPLPPLPASSESDVEIAFAIARRHAATWAKTPVAVRARILRRFHDLVYKRRSQGLDLVQLETGKTRTSAAEELSDVLLTARYYAKISAKALAPQRRRGAIPGITSVRVHHEPVGVVGVISPWNYPLTLAVSDAVAAIMAGNAVVLKPDTQTMFTALWAVQQLYDAGLPQGVLTVVNGEGGVVGPMIVDRADYVMFTGSTAVGRQVASRCGERLISCSMELGGKNAMIVCPDVEIRKAAHIAVAASFANTGQLCISMERIYVPEAIADEFIAELVRQTDALKMGNTIGWGADIGSLVSQKQFTRISEHVADARLRGATVLAGGKPRPDLGPYFFEPTLLTDVHEDMIVANTETFGPVVSIYIVPDVDEAVRLANDSEYGLNAAVLTGDVAAGREIAALLKSGTVNINEGYGAAWASMDAPMGGYRASGMGRRHGVEGLLKYTEAKNVATQRIHSFARPYAVPDRIWSESLTASVALMKKLGLK